MPNGWAELPESVVEIILQKLMLPDYVRLSAVCAAWRSVILQKKPIPRPQLPWLMLSPQLWDNPATRDFLSPSEGRIYNLDWPEHGRCCGAYEGWLMIEIQDHMRNSFLLNPITGVKIRVPRLSTLPCSAGYLQNSILTATLSSIHTVTSNFVVVCIYGTGRLALCTPQVERWYMVGEEGTCYLATTFLDGNFCAIDDQMQLWSATRGDMNTMQRIWKVFIISPPTSPCFDPQISHYYKRTTYLATHGGKLLLVCRLWRPEGVYKTTMANMITINNLTKAFCVFELNLSICGWNTIRSLGDHMLVLGNHYAKSISAKNAFGALADRIYFIDDSLDLIEDFSFILRPNRTLLVHNHENKSILPYASGGHDPFHGPSVWLIPNIWY